MNYIKFKSYPSTAPGSSGAVQKLKHHTAVLDSLTLKCPVAMGKSVVLNKSDMHCTPARKHSLDLKSMCN